MKGDITKWAKARSRVTPFDTRFRLYLDRPTLEVVRTMSKELDLTQQSVGTLCLTLGMASLIAGPKLDREKFKFTRKLGQVELVEGDAVKVLKYAYKMKSAGPDSAMLFWRSSLGLTPDDKSFWKYQGDRVEAAINQLLDEGALDLVAAVSKNTGKKYDRMIVTDETRGKFETTRPKLRSRVTRGKARPKGGR